MLCILLLETPTHYQDALHPIHRTSIPCEGALHPLHGDFSTQDALHPFTELQYNTRVCCFPSIEISAHYRDALHPLHGDSSTPGCTASLHQALIQYKDVLHPLYRTPIQGCATSHPERFQYIAGMRCIPSKNSNKLQGCAASHPQGLQYTRMRCIPSTKAPVH